jgi:hypothetical protein
VFPAKVDGITLAGRGFGSFEALATDMGSISAGLGRKLDGVLATASDRQDRPDRLSRAAPALLDHTEDGRFLTHTSGHIGRHRFARWTAFRSFPISVSATPMRRVSLDTGSTGSIGLFQSALGLPGIGSALHEIGTITRTGARGKAKSVSYRFDLPVGFGPFTLPAALREHL